MHSSPLHPARQNKSMARVSFLDVGPSTFTLFFSNSSGINWKIINTHMLILRNPTLPTRQRCRCANVASLFFPINIFKWWETGDVYEWNARKRWIHFGRTLISPGKILEKNTFICNINIHPMHWPRGDLVPTRRGPGTDPVPTPSSRFHSGFSFFFFLCRGGRFLMLNSNTINPSVLLVDRTVFSSTMWPTGPRGSLQSSSFTCSSVLLVINPARGDIGVN